MKRALITLIAGATLALAQPPVGATGGGQPNYDAIKAYLGLSDTLIQSLEQLHTAERQEAQTLMQSIQQKQQAVQQGLQNSASAATLGQLLLDIQSLQKQVQSIRTKYQDQALALLSPDQKVKLKTLSDAAALQPDIQEAIELQLLAPPANSNPGIGPGPGGFRFGPGMFRRGRPMPPPAQN